MNDLSGQNIKGYELHERIGAGGFGAVYRAFQSTVGREVAMKVILPGMANQPDFIRRFESEAQLIARLEHHHIVPLYDYWRDPDGAYLVMRWLRGGSLLDLLKKQGRLTIEETVIMMEQLTQALHTAHRNQVIHRDIKPGNILLDEEGNAFLADFGIAKDHTLSQNVTDADGIVGSPDYLSPEQARSEPVTPQTDIYSLGVVLYEMIEGKHPFPNLTPIERLFKHITEPIPDITQLDDSISDEINTIIQKATAKDPMQRFKDVLELAQALRQAAALDENLISTTIVELLTPREQEVLQLIIEGKSNKEIADELVVALSTVKSYVNQIYRKLNVRSRVQAIVKARELELIVNNKVSSTSISMSQLPEPENPYKGLRAFQSADEHHYFGRQKLVDKLLTRLQQDVMYRRFLAVVGPSGSGKSSVVKAGLVPALWRGEISGSDDWYIVEMLPGSHPLDELEIALLRIAGNSGHDLHEQLKRDKRGLVRCANLVLPDDSGELLIVIDQFEEVFAQLDDEAERQHFLDLIYVAMTEERSRIRIVITLRADYYDRPLHYPEFGELIRNRVETVLPLNAEELEHAIREPANLVGVHFDDGLVSRIIQDVHYQPGALPLLQYALTELFERRNGRTLTLTAYQEIGGTGGALANRADEIYIEYDESKREIIRQLFLRLVTLGEGAEDTRRRVNREELLNIASDPDAMDEIIDTYALSRLLSLDHDPATRQPTVEIAHEAILREWDKLSEWLNESRDDIRQERLIAHATDAWQANQQDMSYLLRGVRLEQVEKWRKISQLALTSREITFIEASIAQRKREAEIETERVAREEKQEKRSQVLLRSLVAVFAVATMISVALTIFANNQRLLALNETDTVRSLLLAGGAEDNFEDLDPEGAVALAMQSVQTNNAPAEAFQVLSRVATAPGVFQYIRTPDDVVEHLRVPQDGKHLISASKHMIYVWDVETGNEVNRLDGHSAPISWISLSNDSMVLASSDTEGNVILWNWQTGQAIQQIETAHTKVAYTHFITNSTTGNGLLVLSTDQRDRGDTGEVVGQSELALYDANSGEKITTFSAPDVGEAIQYFNISGDGSRIVTRHRQIDQNPPAYGLVIWDLETGESIREQLFDVESMSWPSLAVLPQSNFSTDGELLLLPLVNFQTREINVELVETDTGEVLQTLLQERSSDLYQWMDSERNQAYIYTESGYGQYDLETGELIRQYNVGGVPVVESNGSKIMFNENGRGVVVVDAMQNLEIVHYVFPTGDEIEATPVFSADGSYIITGDLTGEIRLWSLLPETELRRYSDHQLPAMVAEYMPDGKTILSASGVPPRASQGFGDIHLWDATTGEILQRFEGHNAPIWGLAISPNGQTAVSSALDGTIKAWKITSGELIWDIQLEGDQVVERLAYTPDGTAIIGGLTLFDFSVSLDSAAEVVMWSATSGQEIRRYTLDVPPMSHGGVTAVAISPDGKTAAATILDGDGSILFWFDLETGETLQKLIESRVIRTDGLAFHPNGTMVLTGAFDKAVRLWNLETGALVRQFDGHTTSVHTVAFSEDGTLAISGSGLPGIAGESDDLAILWDVETGKQLQRFEGHQSSLKHVAFSPDNLQVVSAATDGTVRIWEIVHPDDLLAWVSEHRHIRDLTCQESAQFRLSSECGVTN